MKKTKLNFILLVLLVPLLTFCSGVRDAFEGNKRSDQSDEFLVKKKDPLVLPPKYGELPLPKSVGQESKDKSIEKLLGSSSAKGNDPKSISNLENMILKELRKNN